MNPRRFICALGLSTLALSVTVRADSYQFEGSLEYVRDRGVDGDAFSSYDFGLQYYLTPIDTGELPLREAAFLQRAMRINFNMGNQDADIAGQAGAALTRTLGLRYASLNNPFIADAQYTNQKWTGDALDAKADIEGYRLGAGAYLTPSSAVTLAYTKARITSAQSVPIDQTTTGYEIGYKAVIQTAAEKTINAQATYSRLKLEDGAEGANLNRFALLGDYYLSRILSFGAGLDFINGASGYSSRKLQLRAGYFLSEQIAFNAGWSKSWADAGDTKGLNLGFIWRM